MSTPRVPSQQCCFHAKLHSKGAKPTPLRSPSLVIFKKHNIHTTMTTYRAQNALYMRKLLSGRRVGSTQRAIL